MLALRITPLEGPTDDGWRPWHGQPAYAAQAANVAVQRYEDWVPKSAPWRYMKVRGGALAWLGRAGLLLCVPSSWVRGGAHRCCTDVRVFGLGGLLVACCLACSSRVGFACRENLYCLVVARAC